MRAGIVRPNVEIVNAIDERPGLWVLAGLRAELAAHGFGEFVRDGKGPSLRGREVAGRTVVVASGDDPGATLAAIRPDPAPRPV